MLSSQLPIVVNTKLIVTNKHLVNKGVSTRANALR